MSIKNLQTLKLLSNFNKKVTEEKKCYRNFLKKNLTTKENFEFFIKILFLNALTKGKRKDVGSDPAL